mgnify:FL=1
MDELELMNVNKFHLALAHKLDKTKNEALIRKGSNATQL